MTHPLRIWLKAKGMNVKTFSEGAPFSYVTVYTLLKGEGDFSTSTLRGHQQELVATCAHIASTAC